MMNVFTIIFSVFFSILFYVPAFATPPSNVALTYDPSTKMLKADMDHVSKNLEDHHIRKIVIYKNGQEIIVDYLNRQNSPSKVHYEVSVDSRNGDELSMEAFCSKGGVGKGSVVVTIEEQTDEGESSQEVAPQAPVEDSQNTESQPANSSYQSPGGGY